MEREDEAWEALRPVLRTGRNSRYRLLTVVCSQDDWLVRVYPTGAGPVMVWRTEQLTMQSEKAAAHPEQKEWHMHRGYRRLMSAAFVAGAPERMRTLMQCACSSHDLRPYWVQAALAPGRRRVPHVEDLQCRTCQRLTD